MKAYGDNLVVKEIDQPEDEAIIRPNGKHPWAVEVLSVGALVNSNPNKEKIEVGDYAAAGGAVSAMEGTDKCIIHSSQVKAIVTEDEL